MTTDKLHNQVQPLNIVVLADLHDCKFGYRNEKLFQKIEALQPDIIIVAGDLITKQVTARDSNAFYLLKSLAMKYKVYYGYGNHEQWVEKRWNQGSETPDMEVTLYDSWLMYKKELSDLGVIFLDNQNVFEKLASDEIRISGLSIGEEFFRKKNIADMKSGYVKDQLGSCDGQTFQILIGHNPVYFKEYVDWGADLTFAGHIHGGMVRLPRLGGMISPQVKFFPKYDAGKFEQEGSTMIVSRGLGSHSIMPRLFNPPEIVCVTVSRSNQ